MRLLAALLTFVWLSCSLTAQFAIRGVVDNAQGKPVAAARVVLSGRTGSQAQITDGLGSFEFIVAHTGPFQLTVRPPYGAEESFQISYSSEPVVIRLHSAAVAPGRKGNAHSEVATDSLNDLEASPKAKSELGHAKKAMQKGDYRQAAQFTNAALRDAPNWSKAYLMRGVIDSDVHNYDGAQASLARAIQIDPRNAMALTEMGRVQAELGHPAQAARYLRSALVLPPVPWLTYLELADVDLTQRNFAEAKAMAVHAEGCQPPPPPQAYFTAGIADFELHQYRQAQTDFRDFLAHAPQTPALAKARAGAQGNLKIIAKLLAQH